MKRAQERSPYPSFVKDTGRSRSWWSVETTDDDSRNSELGSKFAIEYLDNEELRKGNGSLGWIVGAMPRDLGPIEIAFLSLIEIAAMSGRDRAREVAEYWRECQARDGGAS